MLDRAVLTVARAQIKDLFGFEEADENRAFRYQAYKQYTLGANGKLDRRSTKSIPACCSIAIRKQYPDFEKKKKKIVPFFAIKDNI